MMLSILTESAAQMSGVERVSIWALTDDHQELRCLELYERTSAGTARAAALPPSAIPLFPGLAYGQLHCRR
jgi:hypothetical protein